MLDIVNRPGFMVRDQWEASMQALIQLRAQVFLKSGYLSDEEVGRALLTPCHSIESTLAELTDRYGPDTSICVLPQGPQTIPVLKARLGLTDGPRGRQK